MDDPIALDAYERLAESYAARAETKAHSADYERPATLSLLPPVKGRSVLDAGCGAGVCAQWLVERGVLVVALDVSPTMIRLAQERLRGRARLIQADLGRGLDGLADGSSDLVVSALVLDYVRDWTFSFKEFWPYRSRLSPATPPYLVVPGPPRANGPGRSSWTRLRAPSSDAARSHTRTRESASPRATNRPSREDARQRAPESI
jgi:SAM-dependent methyltransferase